MSLTRPVPHIPDETFQAARKGFNLHHIYLRIGDHLDDLSIAVNLTDLDSSTSLGQDMVVRLALVTAFQYAESLPDPLASEATLKRLDWKYGLYLPAQHPGIHAENLSAFRHSLSASPKRLQEFKRLLVWLGDFGLYSGITDRNPESITVLHQICKITRIYRLHQAMKAGLGAIVSCDPNWLRVHILPHWYERYKTSTELQFSHADQNMILQQAMTLGEDISRLLDTVKQPNAAEMAYLPEIRRLAQLLRDEYIQDGQTLTWKLPGYTNCTCNFLERANH